MAEDYEGLTKAVFEAARQEVLDKSIETSHAVYETLSKHFPGIENSLSSQGALIEASCLIEPEEVESYLQTYKKLSEMHEPPIDGVEMDLDPDRRAAIIRGAAILHYTSAFSTLNEILAKKE